VTPLSDTVVHLRVHTEYSIADGLIKVNDLARRAAALDMPAVAITDRSNLFGLIKFYQACIEQGVKPLIGVDLAFRDAAVDDAAEYRCILLALDNRGYRALLELVSRSYTHAERRGVVERDWLFECAPGLIVLSGGVGGQLGQLLLSGDPDRACEVALQWREAFGDRFYIELMRTGRDSEQAYLTAALGLAAQLDIPVVASNDVCFLDADHFEAHETRVCIQEGRTLDDPRRPRRYTAQQYFATGAEMRERFGGLEEAIENGLEIAKRCNVTIDLDTYFLPDYPVPAGTQLETYLRERARAGLDERLAVIARRRPDGVEDGLYRDRLGTELDIIIGMGFAGYFLVVMEFIEWARSQQIPVGPGRGSGAGSLVAYSLGITDVDPLEYGLLFERFLNPERVSLPDFDIDFCMEGRDKVIAHVAELYGEDAVSQIITFGTMAAKAVVRDVARVQGKPYGLADRLSKLIPFEVGMTLDKAVAQVAELRDLISGDEEVAEIMDMAYKLEGIVRNVGRHAGGVVIAPSRLTDFVPLYAEDAGGGLVSQFDLVDVERAGLVKFDFLGLKTLTVIDWAVAGINAGRDAGSQIDIVEIPLDDVATYQTLKHAQTTGVFQLESRGMKDLMTRLLPDRIDDIIALVALFRPGPLQSGAVEAYIDRKHGRMPVVYPHPCLEESLRETYGVMLYQEHVMQIAQELAGFTLGQADLLRRAMGKKKPEEMAKMRQQFTDGVVANDASAALANEIFDDMEKFAGYAFNKSHSSAYALVSYQTAWLKTHHPTHFMAAVLSADMQNTDKIVTLIDEVQCMQLALHGPDVNRSAFRFTVQDDAIVYGLGAVKGVGEGPVAAIIEERVHGAFVNLDDFCQRVDGRKTNRRVLEALIRAGAMDGFGASDEPSEHIRARLLDTLGDAVQGAEQVARDAASGITDLFGGVAAAERAPTRAVEVVPLTRRERLEGERDTLGLYLNGHPIDDYIDEIRRFCPIRIADLKAGRGNQVVAGLVVSSRTMRGRRGDMAFTVIDDRSGRIELSLFSETYQEHRRKIDKDAVIVVEGETQTDDFSGALKMRVARVFTMDEARQHFAGWLQIDVDGSVQQADLPARLRRLLKPVRDEDGGDGCAIAVAYRRHDAEGQVLLGPRWRVVPSDEMLNRLRAEFGADQVHLSYPRAAM
jgi:DNA polymerase-3 subunit alpha